MYIAHQVIFTTKPTINNEYNIKTGNNGKADLPLSVKLLKE